MTSSTYNRGEWAELYVLAKVLCDQAITAQVQENHAEETSSSKMLKVLQISRGFGDVAERYSVSGNNILCLHTSMTTGRDQICSLVKPLLDQIKTSKGNSFSLSVGEELMQLLGISRLKHGSNEKSDIYVSVEDPLTGTTGMQGYTIKALLGSKPTLFNASEPTNFTYRIDPMPSQGEIDRYNSVNSNGKKVFGPRRIVSDLLMNGYGLAFTHVDHRFRENLELLDTEMPTLIGDLILTYYAYEAGTDPSVLGNVEALVNANPRQKSNPRTVYKKKVQDFLEAAAYGMVPTESYDGTRSASGGLLLVEKNGDLKCFRLDDKDRSRDYLFKHTAFETASRSKHGFGAIEVADGVAYLKLNLQIRYK